MSTVKKVTRCLTEPTTFQVAGATRNLHDFYRNNNSIWTSPNFNKFVLAGMSAGDVTTQDARWMYADLALEANDDEIENGMPGGHTFKKRDQFLGHAATLIVAQQDGKEGLLLSRDYLVNIAHVEFGEAQPFVVAFYWFPSHVQWVCDARPRGADRCYADYRAFRNCS